MKTHLADTRFAFSAGQVFDYHGKFLRKFGSNGSGDGQFDYVQGVALDAVGNVVVCDGRHRIQILKSDGAFITKFGSEGSEVGQFDRPICAVVDRSGRICVGDRACRVQMFGFGYWCA